MYPEKENALLTNWSLIKDQILVYLQETSKDASTQMLLACIPSLHSQKKLLSHSQQVTNRHSIVRFTTF